MQIIIIRFILGICFLQLAGCAPMQHYPKSDHYDGSRFFNPADPAGNSLWDGLKVLFAFDFAHWPDQVDNAPALHLHDKLAGDEVAITFVNHASVLIQTEHMNLLTDPVWSERVSPLSWIGPKRHRQPGIAFADLPKIDVVIISHNHYDHMDLDTLKQLEERFHPLFFVPLGNKKLLEDNGVTQVVELDWWQSHPLASGVKLSLTPAAHFSGRGLFDRDRSLWGSYHLSFNGHSLYFGGDTAYSPHFKAIQERFGPPDIALLPIGAFEPRWFMKQVHIDPAEAVQAHLDLGARQSIGMHFGTFQLTNESIGQPVKDLQSALQNKKVMASEFAVLGEGSTTRFKLKSATVLSQAE
ncbi:MBL fold metallo-hydrolase [Undibacterium sp. Ji42W]|uniref:MBL fold metallo-hydrolase n=1 Tax=Undibacterium sp. Ji42W TaxID=3413039 RepID=UPI003BF16468